MRIAGWVQHCRQLCEKCRNACNFLRSAKMPAAALEVQINNRIRAGWVQKCQQLRSLKGIEIATSAIQKGLKFFIRARQLGKAASGYAMDGL
eukprot:1145950-Pelagomonas_calceolata.AAC.3